MFSSLVPEGAEPAESRGSAGYVTLFGSLCRSLKRLNLAAAVLRKIKRTATLLDTSNAEATLAMRSFLSTQDVAAPEGGAPAPCILLSGLAQ